MMRKKWFAFAFVALALSSIAQANTIITQFSLDTHPGWTNEGAWAFGQPTGQGGGEGGYPDPTSGFTGANVYGVNLNGDYAMNSGGPYYLTAGPFNCSRYTNVTLTFYRWLNTDEPSGAEAMIEISTNRLNWIGLWFNPNWIFENAWSKVSCPLGGANNQPNVYVRWGYAAHEAFAPYSGWNMDDIRLEGDRMEELSISPTNGIASVGYEGGSFSTTQSVYTLQNDAIPLNWTSLVSTSWVSVTPSFGTLPPFGATNVTVTIHANALSLPYGTYTNTISFSNQTFGTVQSRNVILNVLAPPPTYEERAAQAIAFFKTETNMVALSDNSPKFTFFYAEARFYDYVNTGKTNAALLADARNCVSNGLKILNNGGDTAFSLWRAVDCYLRYSNFYGNALIAQTTNALLRSPSYTNHSTENKKWMAATARYLVSELWPAETVANPYDTSDITGANLLLTKTLSYSNEGEVEHNSPTYFAMHYGPLRTLADFATNSLIRNRAAIIAEWLLASSAGEWLDGLWCASTERAHDYSNFRSQSIYGAGTSTLRLLYGGPDPINWTNELVDCVQSVCSSYRAPDLFLRIAAHRAVAYTHRETHYNDAVKLYAYLTTYINKDYALYSQHEYLPNGWTSAGKDMIMRWGAAFRRPAGYCTFFVQHYNGRNIPLMGSTEYEQVLQSSNALIGVWNKPNTNVIGYKGQSSINPILGWIPANPDAQINDSTNKGQLYLHYGNVMIALHISRPFAWDGQGHDSYTTPSFSIPDTPGSNRLGMIVELASPANYGGGTASNQLALFKTAFTHNWTNRYFLSTNSTNITLTYAALNSNTLKTSLSLKINYTNVLSTTNGSDYINGSNIIYTQTAWPLLDDPWVHQDYKGTLLTVSNGAEKRIYDFSDDNNWKIYANPAITSAPSAHALVGNPYTYTAQASGNPPPTYTLRTNPVGMTIHTNTGTISWTPTNAGTYEVTVLASNGISPNAAQPFTITVAARFDSDSDEIDDAWENHYFGNPSNCAPTAIASNGVNTIWEAYLADINPTDSNSFFKIEQFQALPETSQIVVRWTSSSNCSYDIKWVSNLIGVFTTIQSNILHPTNSYTDTVHGVDTKGFYKIDVRRNH